MSLHVHLARITTACPQEGQPQAIASKLEGPRCLARSQTQGLCRTHCTTTPPETDASHLRKRHIHREPRWARAYGEAVGQGDHDRMQASGGCCGIDAHPDGRAGAVGGQPAPAACVSRVPTSGACTCGSVPEHVEPPKRSTLAMLSGGLSSNSMLLCNRVVCQQVAGNQHLRVTRWLHGMGNRGKCQAVVCWLHSCTWKAKAGQADLPDTEQGAKKKVGSKIEVWGLARACCHRSCPGMAHGQAKLGAASLRQEKCTGALKPVSQLLAGRCSGR